jgi:hypothetical protein
MSGGGHLIDVEELDKASRSAGGLRASYGNVLELYQESSTSTGS